MTDRYLSRDIRDKIITLLNDNSTGFNALLSTIDTERSETTPKANDITYKWGMNQFDWLFVEMGNSETSEEVIDDSYKLLTETYDCNITGFMKSLDELIYNWIENWAECVCRVLHGYADTYITAIIISGTERADLYTDKNELIKAITIKLKIRIN